MENMLDLFLNYIKQYPILGLLITFIILAILVYLEFKKNFKK